MNKKAQIGEAMAWIVATIVIIVILLIFIYVSSILAKAKNISFSGDSEKGRLDIIKVKNSLSYSLNDENREKIELWLNEKNN